ncbi:hypothetical protein M422DRAFT_170675 [Sphaerobolus stellatus SS14]|uniref:Uncharacterized protein n=1 Tax=Sphaerobolus stellatus (strain SS14) TaxID=990650 RepID=A0A0C9VLX9_SPHS4|nr:hypothetical protein M422DRAFT_170675 [Sphaerobolus stellatus SS14]
MKMKGHNGICSCRRCQALAVQPPLPPGARIMPYYLPFRRPTGYPMPQHYDPHNLPLRTHEEFIKQASEVTNAHTQMESERLAKLYGIKGMPLAAYVSSLSFPQSFPYDFMHLLENIMEIMVGHWTGNFKALDAGAGTYEIPKAIWETIGNVTFESNTTIPSAFGRRIANIAEDCSYFTAEAWLVWTTLLAPEILQGRLDNRYYIHFLHFVKLVKLTISFEYSRDDLIKLKEGWCE